MDSRKSHDDAKRTGPRSDGLKSKVEVGPANTTASPAVAKGDSRRPWSARRASGPRWADAVAQF